MNYSLGTAEGKIVIDSSGVDGAVSAANSSLNNLGKGSKFNAAEFGSAMTLGVTAPILAVGGAALKTAVDFETAFAGVEKTVDAPREVLDKLRQGIVDMSKEIPAGTTEIAAVAEAAGQLGVAAEDILPFTRVMIDLGNATNITSTQAATDIARIQNIMGSGVDTVDEFGATIVALGNNSATTESEILELANRLAGISAQTGITEDAMLAIAATMSSVGVAAESGGTSITKTVKDFGSWTRSIQDATAAGEELAGTDAVFAGLIGNMDEFANMTGDQQLLAFVEALQEVEANGGNVVKTLEDLEITEIRQSDALLKLVGSGDLLSESLTLGAEAWEENSALTEETGKRYATTASQLEIAKNNATDILRVLGEAFIQVLKDMTTVGLEVASVLGTFAAAFGALPEPVRKLVAGFLLFLAAIGPIFFVGAKVVKTIQTIGTAFKALGIVMSLNPFVLIVLAIIALVAAFVILYKRSEKFRKFVNNLGKSIEKAFKAVVDFFKSLPGVFSKVWDEVTDAFETAKDAVIGAFEAVVDWFKELPGVIGGFLGDVIDEVTTFVGDVLGKIGNFFSELWDATVEGLANAWDAFVEFLTELPERFAYFLGLVIGTYIRFQIELIKFVIQTGIDVTKAIIEFMTELPGIIWGFLTEAISRFIEFGTTIIERNIYFWTEVVKFLIAKLTEFVTWLPGFIADVISRIVGWGVDMVNRAVQIATDFVSSLIGILLGLPGKVFDVIRSIITGLPGFLADIGSKAAELGAKLLSGFLGGIGDIAGALWNVVNNAISGVGNLATSAFNKGKEIGGGFWNGIKNGLGINSPSYVEEAFFAMEANVSDSINGLARSVREVHGLSRGIPDLTSANGTLGAAGAQGLARPAASGSGTSPSGVGLTVQGPLVGEIRTDASEADALEWSRRLADLTYTQLEAQGNRGARVNGALHASG